MANFLDNFTVVGSIAKGVTKAVESVDTDAAINAAIGSASQAVQEGNKLFRAGLEKANKLAAQAGAAAQTAGQNIPDPLGALQEGAQAIGEAAFELLPEREDVIEDIKMTSEAITGGALNLGQTAKTLWNLGTSTPAKLLKEDVLLFDFVKENSVINESSFEDDEIEFLKELARKKGTGRVTKADYGSLRDTSVRGAAEADVLTTGSLSAADRVYNSLSEFMIRKDPETGEYFAEDTYDWNLYVDYNDPSGGIDKKTGRPRGVVYTTEEFEEKFNPMEELFNTINSDASAFEKAHNLAFLLGSRDYVDNSKDTGRKVRINLGKLD